MVHKFLKLRSNNRGFTLVELIIVVAILGVLAAIIVPNVTGLASYGETEAAVQELSIVQSAVDIMMAKTGLTAVNVTTATSDMSAFPTGSSLYPSYLRTTTTKGTYSVVASGLVTQATTGY